MAIRAGADSLTGRRSGRGGLMLQSWGAEADEPPEIPKLPRVALSLRPGAA